MGQCEVLGTGKSAWSLERKQIDCTLFLKHKTLGEQRGFAGEVKARIGFVAQGE